MSSVVRGAAFAVVCLGAALAAPGRSAAQQAPPGFQTELLLQAPELEHPSVVACDDAGNLFVGEDPMDMRGPATREFDRILYLVFDAEGQIVRRTVFAEGLSAVFGLIWLDDALYVMHAPHYSVFRDLDGDGVADERRDLAEGFGPPAGIYGFNDHIVTGIRLGLDGLVYVSVGDKGVPLATGADGSQITLEGGGVVRMRPDGTQLEVFSSGTRNHLDVAMDSLDRIFTYDNTDDGLGWWTRLTYHVESGYYGYPYDYHPHPERHLPRIGEHGGGSPVGAACYREAAWPERYRDTAFFCEWGKGKVQRFSPTPDGAGFTGETGDFLVNDGSGEFRPLDLCFSPDGRHMYVADWNFAGWMQPQVAGRLFRVTYVGGDAPTEPARATDAAPLAAQLAALGHPALSERQRAQQAFVRLGGGAVEPLARLLADPAAAPRAKIHAIWALNGVIDQVSGFDPCPLWTVALADTDPQVRAQAARALGLRRMSAAVAPLCAALADAEAPVRLQAATALGRLGDGQATGALFAALADGDVYVRHCAMQALRRINDWQLAPQYLASEDEALRKATLVTLSTVYDEGAVAALADAAHESADAELQAGALAALAEVYRQADPYTGGWWGTQPARGQPARSKKHDWAGSSTVLAALRDGLHLAAPQARLAAIAGLAASGNPLAAADLRTALRSEQPVEIHLAIVDALAALRDAESVPLLAQLAANRDLEEELRTKVVQALAAIGSPTALAQLVALVADPQSSPPLVQAALTALAGIAPREAAPVVQARLTDAVPAVRSAAAATLVRLLGGEAVSLIVPLLTDEELAVRATAVGLLADVQARDALPALLAAADDPALRPAAIAAVVRMPDRRALGLYLEGVVDPDPTRRDPCRAALVAIRHEIADDVLRLQTAGELSAPVRRELQIVFSTPVPLRDWQLLGAWDKAREIAFDATRAPQLDQSVRDGERELRWQAVHTDHPEGAVAPDQFVQPTANCWTLAYAAVDVVAGPIQTQLFFGSDDQAVVWLNGEKVYEHLGDRGWGPGQGQANVMLRQGVNHLYFQTGNTSGPWQFSAALAQTEERFAPLFADLPPELDTAAYREFALGRPGDAAAGQQLFFAERGVGCYKCHKVAGRGSDIGPDLSGIGAKYGREELIRSVLEPSNRVAEAFQVTTILTTDGELLQGIVKTDTDQFIELVDVQGKVQRVELAEVDVRERTPLSLMPNGLKDGLTLEGFADIIAFLESLKAPPPGAESDAK